MFVTTFRQAPVVDLLKVWGTAAFTLTMMLMFSHVPRDT